ncbi:peptidoglycan L-alanyl-D-glutamate endopeptidase CwlK [Cohnella sp. OV330]|uniref:M15 family metallopeptidase n=1 Tax=Cohnella sp. OV330 TaxID=1855288 RepID=UPI0008E4E414|nr:M15 family metallopeptidase [Cohnella sp. OV330]SFB10460.1 peptidoglycan L-alanyl-D-glutamate endopeptidase CwlK [Cohnella sp. OV330]
MNLEPSGASLARRRASPSRRRGRLLLAACIAAALIVVANLPAVKLLLPAELWREVPPVVALHPLVSAKMKTLKAEAATQGIRIAITDGFRSETEQDALYRKGRSAPGAIVTHAKGGQSYHNYGLAIDFAIRAKDGDVLWDMEYDGNRNGKSDWMEVVGIAKRLGFAWGGDWESFPDYPHLQMDFGLSIPELQRGHRPPQDLRLAEERAQQAGGKA